VHHGTFRHEQGTPTLDSEKGWQFDASYAFEGKNISVSVSPFATWFSNYIYLRPTGEWSVLPHAGQIYRHTGTEALFAGAELSLDVDLPLNLHYCLSTEYVRTYNVSESVPLSFSPPASMRNSLIWKKKDVQLYVEAESIADQRRVAKNEDPTSGANLLHAGASMDISLNKMRFEVTCALHNIFNTKYYNHFSFYRKVEIPEPGRNFQIIIKIPFFSKF
jgi:iron complex outermembrane receptor protein